MMTAWTWKSTTRRRPLDVIDTAAMMSCVPLLQGKSLKQKEELSDISMILYQQTGSNRISRLLAKCKIKTFHIPVKKNIYVLTVLKDKVGLKASHVIVARYMLARWAEP
jgi:hypothetical protein